jgi:GNAT superfamily N-acetyltransferase
VIADLVDGRAVDASTAEEIASVVNAAGAVDAPHVEPISGAYMQRALRHGWDGRGVENVVVGRVDGRLAAYAEIELPTWDNHHMAFVELFVRPEHRGSGLGRDIVDQVHALMKTADRTLIVANAWAGSHLERFWLDQGLESASAAAQRRLIPADLDWPQLQAILAESATASADYEIVEVPQPVPDDMIDGMLELQRTMNDAPLDDLALEDEVWTEERYRGHEQALAHRGMRNIVLAARDSTTAELAGYTAVVVEDERPHLGFQEDTVVARQHRGHRLGLRLKIEMLRLLREREPQIRQIDTWNAVSNRHMIAVNEAIGCFVVGVGSEMQRDLTGRLTDG